MNDSEAPPGTAVLDDPIIVDALHHDERCDRDRHRVAQDYDDDASVLEQCEGHAHVIAHLRDEALHWRRTVS